MSELHSGWLMCDDYESHWFSRDRVAPCGELIALDNTYEVPKDTPLVLLDDAKRVCRRCLRKLRAKELNDSR
jgi:hypothetical protein